jgi:hypothetical protein
MKFDDLAQPPSLLLSFQGGAGPPMHESYNMGYVDRSRTNKTPPPYGFTNTVSTSVAGSRGASVCMCFMILRSVKDFDK